MKTIKHFLIALAIACPAAGAAAESSETLAQKVERAVTAGLKSNRVAATIGIYVLDAKSGKVLAERNGEKPLKPASCNKLLTTGAGLFTFGPDHRFVTEVLAGGSVNDGTLHGDLIVYGGGDPTISGRFQPNKKDITRTMRDWADELTSRGIRRIEGDIVADDTFFARDYFHPNWYVDERGEWYEAEISGLAFNDNCIDLTWSAKDQVPGDRAGLVINPVTSYAKVDNQVHVVARGRESERYYIRADGSNDILATGTITVDSTAEDSASISNGGLYFVTVFKDVLTKQGVDVSGKPRLITEARAAEIRRGAGRLIRHESPPMADIINVINLNSQNFYADSLAKAIGRKRVNDPSFAGAALAVEQFWREAGVYTAGNDVVDGSGLSAENQVTCRQLAEVVRYMDRSKYSRQWRESLPLGGIRGSLKSRFQQDAHARAVAKQIMGKTGLIGGVRALSGILRTRGGDEMYYSIILNDIKGSGSSAISLIDSVAVELAKIQ